MMLFANPDEWFNVKYLEKIAHLMKELNVTDGGFREGVRT